MSIWPFKRKTPKSSDSINDANFLQPQTRKSSKVAIMGGFIGAFICLAAGATGIGISAWKYAAGSEFSKSYNIRFEVDNKSETPFTSEHEIQGEFRENLNATANAYSKYLNAKGINNVNVYPEYVDDAHGYINANVPNERYYDGLDETWTDMNPTSIYEENINSSRLSLIVNIDGENGYSPVIIPLNNGGTNGSSIIDNITINGTDKKEVDIKLKSGYGLKDVVNTYLRQDPDSDQATGDDSEIDTQVFLVRDFNGMVNYMNYVLQVYFENKITGGSLRDIIDNFGGNGEEDFFQDFWDTTTTSAGDAFIGTTPNYIDYNESSGQINIINTRGDTEGSNAPFWFTCDGSGTHSGDDVKKLNYKFLSKYVVGLGTRFIGEAKDASAANGDYTSVIPYNNPITGKPDDSYQYVVARMDSRNEANELLENTKNNAFSLPTTIDGNHPEFIGNAYTAGTLVDIRKQVIEQTQTLATTIFGFEPLVGMLISLCLIVLAIGILISVLYRGPGAIGMLAVIASFSIALMILVLSNYALSVAMFMGLFVGVIGSILSVLGFSERIKKIYQTGIAFDSALRKGLKSGFLPMLDIHAIMLLIGVGVAYFGGVQITIFGTALLLYSILSFVFVGAIWLGATFLLINNRIGINKPQWFFGKNKQPKRMVKLLDNKSYETTYCGQFEPKRFSVFGWKQILCASLVLAIGIVGIILILVLGVHSSYLFYGGTRIMTSVDLFNAHQGSFAGYSEKVVSGSIVYLYYDRAFTLPGAGDWWQPGFNGFNIDGIPLSDPTAWVSIQTINAAGAIDYAVKTIYVLLIASGLISVYTFVRLNWVSVIPVFLGTLATPLLAVGIIAICQIYFDLYIIMAIVILYAINAILVINLIGTLNNQWLRKQIYHKQDLKKLINAEVKNALSFYLKFYAILCASFLIFMFFNSPDLLWLFLIITIGVICSIVILYSVVPFFLYLFIRLRYLYLLRTSNIENPLLRKNYDSVDEQLLDDINKFKRKRPTL